ncbi:MAG: HRDC domain-containing protein [Propionicimonas sp.]|nr:HRDC domain-containing protein [Propionicimonas sp.]
MTATLLTEPADGIPAITDTPEALADTIAALAAGSGPLAVDTERAQGFRYTGKAYLIQLRRAGAGTHLVDPIAFEDGSERADLSALCVAVEQAEWILHAASQDLPCLAEVKLWPQTLFDTELAARLLGIPRVNLGALMEEALEITLLKEHSAADWSRRPLPPEWLAYAALDVERLDDLRLWLIDQLEAAGKLDWAYQEFAHLVAHAKDVPAAPADPWRRTSGLHAVRSGLGLAVVRALWQARDGLARELDRGPGRILNDRAITEVAAMVEQTKKAPTRLELRKVRGFTMRSATRHEAVWLDAIDQALQLPRSELPPRQLAASGPPPPRSWESRWPESFARWSRVRPALVERAEELQLPVENLISPDVVKRLLWDSADHTDARYLTERLEEFGARPWQRDLVIPVLLEAWN